MQDEQMKRGQDIRKKIEEFLKEYNKDKGYADIFSNSQGLMYYKDTAYNITNDMIKGLNESYKKQH
jgi:outer membrane protein